MSQLHQLDAIERLVDIFDTVGIVYAIEGSIASSFHGAMRYTQDADMAVRSFLPLADQFFNLAKNEFYVSEQAMRDALNSAGSFNVIHFETAFKIDVFVLGPGEFEQHVLERREKVRLNDVSRRDVCVVSPEDIILLKLRWFLAPRPRSRGRARSSPRGARCTVPSSPTADVGFWLFGSFCATTRFRGASEPSRFAGRPAGFVVRLN